MLQRKQSIWLLLAALLNAGVFVADLYRYDLVTNGLTEHKALRVSDHYPSLLIALVMTLLPLVAIFMFSNRKRQIRMSIMGVASTGSFVTLMLNRVTRLENMVPPPIGGTYWIGAVLPILTFVFFILAILGIRKDEKLVRSVDRLR